MPQRRLYALGRPAQGGRLVEAVVDSGAVDSVAPPGTFDGAPRPSAMSRGGKRYHGPDGSPIPNLGQQDVGFRTEEGHQCRLTWQVAQIERPLVAVSHLSASGHKVVLGKDGGEIVHLSSGRKIRLHRRGGVYVLRMWVPAAGTAQGRDDRAASGFPRPGAP